MFTRYLLPLLAITGLGFAIFTVLQSRQADPPAQPLMTPPIRPHFDVVAGAGLVEARQENIPVGTHEPGVVSEVSVRVGDHVKRGDPLFRLDDRPARAELAIRKAMLAAAEAELQRLRDAPRPEDIPPAEAAVAEARARYQEAETAFSRSNRLRRQNAITDSEYDRDRFTYQAAKAAFEKATADRDRLVSGTWAADIAVAEAKVAEARSQVEAAQVRLERMTVEALADGEVLQVNVRPGQFAALAWNEPLVVLGDLSRLHVRVDIDEQDLPMFQPGARAVAKPRGRPEIELPMEFVRVEPYVIPKRSLTGATAERVDTRVLQVIYALRETPPIPLYVGQQLDVYIEAAETAEAHRASPVGSFADEPTRAE